MKWSGKWRVLLEARTTGISCAKNYDYQFITPCLLQLDWLPVRWCIQFKLCCIMHSVFNGNCPAYLSDIVQTVSASRPRLRLRSSSSTDYVSPRLCTKFGERAFSHAGPSDYQKTFSRNLTSPTFGNFLKLTILILCSTFNNCILSFYFQLRLKCTHGLPVMGALEMLWAWV